MSDTTAAEDATGSRGGLLLAVLGELRAFARRRGLLVAALMLLVAVLEGSGLMLLAPLLSLVGVAASPVSTGGPLDAVSGQFGQALTLKAVLLLYLALIALHALLSWWRDVAAMELQQGFVDHLRLQLYRAIGFAEWSFLARTHSAKLDHALHTDLGRISLGLASLLQLLTTGVMALAYILIALNISPPLTATSLFIGGLLLLLLRRRHGQAHSAGYRLTRVMQKVHAEVSEFLAGLRLIKSSNTEHATLLRYGNRLQKARKELVEFTHRQAVSRNLLRVGGAVALAGLTYTALVVMESPPASMLVLVFIFSRLFPFLSTMQQAYERLLYNLPAYASFDEMRRACAAAAEVPSRGPTPAFTSELRLQGVCYRPPFAEADILSGITLTLPCRGTVALVGPSGAGKSTLADIVGGLLAPTSGTLLLDGRELQDRRAWREQVAYVSQDSFLLNASVRENLLWTHPGADEAELWEVLERAAANFVRDLPRGLDTELGERGVRLSGGERQRLTIARALLRKPRLLILDEATSALDRANEQRIQEAVTALHGQLSILVIAHRIDTVRNADCIHVVKDGMIHESGRFAQLGNHVSSYLSGAASTVHA